MPAMMKTIMSFLLRQFRSKAYVIDRFDISLSAFTLTAKKYQKIVRRRREGVKRS